MDLARSRWLGLDRPTYAAPRGGSRWDGVLGQDDVVTIDFWISSLTFSDGTNVATPRKGITVLVGPNNSGKTASLQDLFANLNTQYSKQQAKAVRDVAFETQGNTEDLQTWINQHAHQERNTGHHSYRRMYTQAAWDTLQYDWQTSGNGYLGSLLNFLTLYADVDSRAQLVSGGSPSDFYDQVPSSPVHYLYLDGSLEEEFSSICQSAFGESITLQRLGPSYQLRVGTPSADVPPLNRPTREYADAEKALPTLAEQGHGMRSFMGLALLLLVQSYHVIAIDEPEAFLHPPQRRALGRLVSDLAARKGSQLFISTHDTEFLWGLLDGPSDVAVVRLTRNGSVNHAKQINAEQVKTLWTDTLLRYSRIFDGLFYDRVVVAESDADCRFFSAILDYLVESGDINRPDVLFVPAGGKDRIHVAVSALRGVGVDVVAATDFDLLRDEQSLRRLVQSANGDWDNCGSLRRRFADAVSSKLVPKPISGLRKSLEQILPEDSANLDRDTSRKVINLFAFKDGWEEAKRTGLAAIPSGDPYKACTSLIDQLERVGIYVSREGELESFVRSEGGHGPKWVASVLSKALHREAREAHEFVRRLVSKR